MTAESPGEEIRGVLAPWVLPEVLRQAYLESSTGVLQVANGAALCAFEFAEGRVQHCETNLTGCQLGDILVEIGFLTAPERDACLEIATLSGQGLSETLIRHSLLDHERLAQARSVQFRQALTRTLAWAEGRYIFETAAPVATKAAGTVRSSGVDPRAVLLDAIWSLAGDPLLARMLGAPQQKIRRASQARLSGLDINLNSTDSFLLSRIDGATSIGEILQVSPVGEDETIASMTGLIAVGAAEIYESEPPRKATAEIHRSKMVRLAGRLHASDPHEVLGIKPTARTEEIRSSYVDLLRMCDPAAEGDSEMRPLLERMTELLTAAFRQIERLKATARPAAAPPTPGPTLKDLPPPKVVLGPARSSEAPAVDPERAAEMAEEAYEQGRVHEALSLLHQAIPDLFGAARRRARVRVCRILLAADNGLKLALDELKVAIDEDPGNIEAHLLMGQVYRAAGASAKAAAAFKKALNLDPRNAAARKALEEVAGDKPKPGDPTKGGSILSRLLGR